MKKLLPIGLGIVALGLLVAPKMIGTQLDNKLNEIAQSVNDMPGYQLNILNKDEAWFTSSATLELVLDLDALSQGQFLGEEWRIPFDFDAVHGPVLLADNASFGLVQWQLKAAGESLREHLSWPLDQAFYQMNAKLGFSSDFDYQDHITAFSGNDDIEGQFRFSGYEGKAEIKQGILEYHGKAARFEANNQSGELLVEDLTMQTQAEVALETLFDQMFYSGEGKLNLSSFTFQEPDGRQTAALKDIYMTSESKINDESDSVDLAVVYGIKSLQLDDFKGEDFKLGLQINNISQTFFKAYQAFAPSLVQASGAQSSAMTMSFLEENLLSLVLTEPEINITSLRASLPQGDFESYLNTRLTGVTALPSKLDDMGFWLSHTNVDGLIKGDKPVIEQAAKWFVMYQLQTNPQTLGMGQAQLEQIVNSQVPMLLQGIEYQGFIVKEEDQYSTKLSLKDKVLTVNAQTIPLPY